ncbi:MAG: YIP1 family protein [Anaerolineales bacterium]|nr:YIP1 family protein [Anaerolineales bacterium]
MTENNTTQLSRPSRFHFKWVPEILFHPRRAFEKVTSQASGVWLTPMLLLTLATLASVLASGWLKQQAAMMGEMSLPPDYEWYTPEQQAQYMQAAQTTQGPVFVYVLPGIAAIGGVWLGWLLVGGLLHLITTLLGGRGDTSVSMNLVAWASLPLTLRELVRFAAMLIGKRLIQSPGISGFAPAGEGAGVIFLAGLMELIDLYLIWHIVLIAIGVRTATHLPGTKAASGAIITILIVMLLQALIGLGIASLSSLTVVRPFFF